MGIRLDSKKLLGIAGSDDFFAALGQYAYHERLMNDSLQTMHEALRGLRDLVRNANRCLLNFDAEAGSGLLKIAERSKCDVLKHAAFANRFAEFCGQDRIKIDVDR